MKGNIQAVWVDNSRSDTYLINIGEAFHSNLNAALDDISIYIILHNGLSYILFAVISLAPAAMPLHSASNPTTILLLWWYYWSL